MSKQVPDVQTYIAVDRARAVVTVTRIHRMRAHITGEMRQACPVRVPSEEARRRLHMTIFGDAGIASLREEKEIPLSLAVSLGLVADEPACPAEPAPGSPGSP